MTNNQLQQGNAVPMPLLMGCTKPSKIQVMEQQDAPMIYDPVAQKIKIDMRTVGTKSLKTTQTKKPCSSLGKGYVNHPDQKNEIDDKKNV